jgi:acetyl esterase
MLDRSRLSLGIADLLDAKRAGDVRPLYTMTVEQARHADLEAIREQAGSREAVASVLDETIPLPSGSIKARVYRPAADDVLPAVVYYFGGGWVLGNLETSDAICRSLCNRGGCAVIAIEYRLAPEHPFPTAVEDAVAGLSWVVSNAAKLTIDPDRIVVAGDSAGGNLAAAVAQILRDGTPRLAGQLLIYPSVDQTASGGSMDLDDPLVFNKRSVDWYRSHYLGSSSDAWDPRASPGLTSNLADLPQAVILTAEFDPLRDEAETYGRRLQDAGVPVRQKRYDGCIHGFFAMLSLPEARAAHDDVGRELRRMFTKRRQDDPDVMRTNSQTVL